MGRLELHRRRGGFGGGLGHVQNRVISARSDVQNHRTGAGPPKRQFHRPRHIRDVGEVAALPPVAVDDERAACHNPACERLQGQVGALAGSPDREKPQRHKAQAVQAGVEAAPLLADELGQRVGAARVGGAVLGERQRAVRAVNARG